jgi:hypothetical protein
MPVRFHRTLRVAPGVKLNFSKSGLSTTVGPKGLHFTFGKRGVRRTISIPGTGISEVDYIKKNETEAEKEKKEKGEEQREEKESLASEGGAAPRTRRSHRNEATATSGWPEWQNILVLLGVMIFLFAGAAVLGLIPAHFFSNSLQFLAQMVHSTGH